MQRAGRADGHGHDRDHHDHDHGSAAHARQPPREASGTVLTRVPGTVATTYRVAELDCATEERDLRDVLEPLVGVRQLAFDLVARQVTISHTLADPGPLAAAIRSVGMRPDEIATPL